MACIISAVTASAPAFANPAAMEVFGGNCFNPFLTAQTAAARLAIPGVRHDFYDLDPFSNVAPSPGTNVTPGTDRRCEVAFDGDHAKAAATYAGRALSIEGITDPAPVPNRYARTKGTELLAARYLNPRRIAVVHVGTRSGPNGTETYITVERMTPLTAKD